MQEWKNLVCVLFVVTLPACVSYKPYLSETQAPGCSVVAIEESDRDANDVVLRLNLKNPNPFPLKIESLQLGLAARDAESAVVHLAREKRLKLNEFSTRELNFSVPSDEWKPLAQSIKGNSLAYHLTGEAQIKTREGVRRVYIDCYGRARMKEKVAGGKSQGETTKP